MARYEAGTASLAGIVACGRGAVGDLKVGRDVFAFWLGCGPFFASVLGVKGCFALPG
jgi:hypothetical protein